MGRASSIESGALMTGTPTSDPDRSGGVGTVDSSHLLSGRPRRCSGADLEPDGIRVATLTIAGRVVAGTAFDPERIAERYWDVVQTDGQWQAEFRFTGE
jgi:hypothetical protein